MGVAAAVGITTAVESGHEAAGRRWNDIGREGEVHQMCTSQSRRGEINAMAQNRRWNDNGGVLERQ